VDTLLALKQEAPGRELVYLIGSDTLFLFPTWRTAEKVARLCSMLVVMRQGDEEADIRAEQARLMARYGLESTLLVARGLPISSSQVRALCRQGKDIAPLLPPKVADFIKRHRLYQG